MTTTLECTRCHAELTGGLDTYGPFGHELCQACWLEDLAGNPTQASGDEPALAWPFPGDWLFPDDEWEADA